MALAIVASTLAGPGQAAEPALNAKIVQYAKSQLGKKVDTGECWELVRRAFEFAGAKMFPPYGPTADYVWGTEIRDQSQIQPGDVIQFRDAEFVSRKTLANGAVQTTTLTLPHHTAIVSAVRNEGKALDVLQQNFGTARMTDAQKRTVQTGTIRVKDLKSGKLWFYRPVPK